MNIWRTMLCASVFCVSATIQGADVLTQHSDNLRTGMVAGPGWNAPTVSRFHKLREWPVDGHVYAQPLFVDGAGSPGGRAAVYVATSANSLYAFDGGTLAPLWGPVRLGPNDRSVMGSPGCDGISADGIGIEATPVIDKPAGVMYVSWRTNTGMDRNQARLVMTGVDIRTGATRLGPVAVQGVPPVWDRSRASLLLDRGVIYVAYGSRCEDPGQPIFHGFIAAFDAKTLRQVGLFQVTPGDVDGGGIWQASTGIASDGDGLYFATGNRRPGIGRTPADADTLADAVVKIRPRLTTATDGSVTQVAMQVVDSFKPYRRVWLDEADMDLGSAGPMMIPGTDYLVEGGKQGLLYVLNRNQMGGLDSGKKWTVADLQKLRADTTADQRPEDYAADHVVQKFQAGFHQYIPANPTHLAIPGSPVTSQNQSEVFTVGRNQAAYVTWKVDGTNWSDNIFGRPGPAQITPAGAMPVGAHLASGMPTANQMEVYYVGNDGAVHVTWKLNNGRWTDGLNGFMGPAQITPAGVAPPGGCLASGMPNSNQLEVYYTGNDGAVHVTWKANNGRWTDGLNGFMGPAQISPAGVALKGGCLASDMPTSSQLEVYYAGMDGAVHVTWKANNGHWTDGLNGFMGPAQITPAHVTVAGAGLASGKPTSSQLEVYYAGVDGAVHVTWKANNGRWTDGLNGFMGPAQITPEGVTTPGAAVASGMPNATQLEVFYGGVDGAAHTTWKVNNGRWTDGRNGFTGPAQISPMWQMPAGAGLAVNKPADNNLEVVYAANTGALNRTWKTNNGRWSDGMNGFAAPARLSRAMWLDDWGMWPHIHGTPVFGRFVDGSGMLYIWPEKDHMKAFPWTGAKFDIDRKILAVDRARKLVVGPDGMPGGMLTAAIDSGQRRAGVVFAAQTLTADTEGPGMLRAFDAVTLAEIWNNQGEAYRFNKFVPATAAAGRVFLPTSSGKVLVYGL